ncbi:glycerol-3-phosphate acyltransferase PlsY [Evansella caseinilytica]|uniref:Glycerol-3-phosphate acyltransferase n=1 Tax=Evansella caseinilytica TaxID=1503961 RepID=A0A1H3NC81_9BACI|nr:glycerol-3-phosphate 1-O-acyltransferase PlsY [Evansella caseinilytica]SDY86561.1 glycerol-3-phosphate acyltransferase PlsY [Evansella caseinilytica]
MTTFISIAISYFIGSISFSYILTKKIKKVDIRQHGSGNAGATNTLRVLGVGPAVAVLLLDCVKGIAAVLLGLTITGDPFVAGASGLAAIIGHNWPIYYGFRGGKGVATTIGVLVTMVFFAALISGIIAILSIVITRFVSLGSLIFVAGTAILSVAFANYFHYPSYYPIFTVTIALLSLWRHRTNIKRLINGEENKIGKKAST